MFIVNDMPPQISDELVGLLMQTDTGTIGHLIEHGFLDPDISAKMPGKKIAGTAITVRVTAPDSVIAHYALKFTRPGDILVIERGPDSNVACWGGTTSQAAVVSGLRGLIMDGRGNDITESNEAGLPIWCRGVTPITTKYRSIGGALNVPISCGGIAVHPGDAVLADENGVLILPPQEAEQLARTAIAFNNKGNDIIEALRNSPGVRYPDLTGASSIVEQFLKSQQGSAN